MKKLAWALIVMCIAFGAATAALWMAGHVLFAPGGKILALDTGNLPPLVAGQAISVTRVFGDDDEDCITITRAAMRPDRLTHLRRKIICEE
jgi:hypothetical protein